MSSPTPSHGGPAVHGTDRLMRAPPPRVMEERAQRDMAHEARRLEADIKHVGKLTFEISKRRDEEKAAADFALEDKQRKIVSVDPASTELLRKLGVSTKDDVRPVQWMDWKSPVRGMAKVERLDTAATDAFLKSIGVYEHNRIGRSHTETPPPQDHGEHPLHSSQRTPPHQPREASVATTHQGEPKPTALTTTPPAKLPARDAPVKTRSYEKQPVDHSRAPSRTLVSRIPALVALSKTKPLAPIPQQPKLASTVVPERGSQVNTEKLLSAFKMQQIEEREFNVDLRSRKMAEEQDGTLLHFEMTSSIKRVEGILSALERGKEYRDMVAYKDKHDERDQLESNFKSSSHDDTTLDELRQVIQILLKDSAQQGQQMQELDQQLRKTTGDLQYVTGENGKKQARIETLQEQLDALVAEREVLKKEKGQLETRVEQLVESTEVLARAAEERRASFLGGSGSADESGSPAPRDGHSDGRQPPRSAVRKPLDAAAMLKELAPALPSLDSVPKGDDVTIVCTAVQSISRLWEQFASDMPTALSLHNRIILEEIPKHRGYQVKTAGEEFLVAFHTTNQAVNFAMAVQEQLVQQVWPQKLSTDPSCAVVPNEAPLDGSDMPLPTGDLWRGLRVAMGIHYGPVHVEFNPVTNGFDYMGSTVNRALLLKRVSQGGMAAVSKEVYDRLNKEMDAMDNEQQQQGTSRLTPRQSPPPAPSMPDASAAPAHSISYAETLRKRSSARNLKALLSSDKDKSGNNVPTALRPITTAFHCKIPAARSAAADVYCVLPASLEGRLMDIQSTNRQKAEAHGVPLDALQPRADDEVPSELEAMLGTFSRRGQKALFLTGEGVEDAAELLSEDEEAEIAIMHAGLPTGTVCLLSIQCEATRNKRLTEKILAKDMEYLIKIFHDSIEMASAPFGAKVVDWRGDIHTLAFGNIGVAVRCALAIDAELTTAPWPKIIDTYKDTEEVVWYGQVRIFAGLRASMGIHVAQMKPHYDPMTKTVGYIGFDSFVAYRLACVAAPGQILLEETAAYAALAVVNPMPLYSHLVPNASGSSSVASRLCIVTSRMYVGRHFVWAGMEQYQLCHTPQFADQYRRMKSDLEIEDIRWKRDATRVVAKEQMSAGITAKTQSAPDEATKKAAEEAEATEQDAEALLGAGLGQKLEAAMAKASGTVTHAMEMRLRDLEVTQILLSTLREKLDSENISELLRDREPIINQMEKLEHNLMVLNDAYLEGQLVAFQPLIADITDLRELPLKGTSRDAPSGTSGGEAPSTGRRRNADDSAWTDVDDEDEDDTKPADDDDDLEAIASLAVADSKGAYGRLSTHEGNQTAAEEELKKRLVVLEEEVLLAHRICRNMFAVLKEWMEPLLSSNARYIMPDEEVVSKLISVDRSAREPYLKKKEKAAPVADKAQSNVVTSIPKTTRQLWRQIIEHAVVDQDVEERMRGKGSKLLKSLESQVCRHFLFLRQYVKRVRVKEKYGGNR